MIKYMRARFSIFIVLSFFSIILNSCGPTFKVGFDYDTEENFANYKSYDFLKDPTGDREKPFVVKRIRAAVKKEKGNFNLLCKHVLFPRDP